MIEQNGCIGPTLPPHLASKRKRSESESSEDGPAPPPGPQAQAPRHQGPMREGPVMPPNKGDQEKPKESLPGPKRVIGPSMPPADLDELPQDAVPTERERSPAEDDSSDDDIGPAPPPADGSIHTGPSWEDIKHSDEPEDTPQPALQREEWMLAPPSGADWAARIDPTKIKSRKFNTMKGAKASSQTGSQGNPIGGSWTETVEQKRKRLQDEVMGTKSMSNPSRDAADRDKGRLRNQEEERETERRVREYNKAHRGSDSLLAKHRTREDAPEEDDPSKRAFDREKDIAGGAVSALQRRELLNKAKSMGSRFEKARYE